MFQVRIKAAGAAIQLVEYEPGIEIDSVFFQQRQIFFFKRHLAVMFLLGMDVLHYSRKVRFAHAKGSIAVLPCESLLMFIHPL